jgi:hypothetical protein
MLKNTRIGALITALDKIDEVELWVQTMDLTEFQEQIIDWIQHQLQDGEDGEGDPMGFYSRATEIISGGEKQEGDPFTLKDTGDFYNSMFISVMADAAIIESDPVKNDGTNLIDEYGQKILKLNEKHFQELKEKVRANYLKVIRQALHTY